MVGARGFEPPTSWSRTRRSNQAEPRPEHVDGSRAESALRDIVSQARRGMHEAGETCHSNVRSSYLGKVESSC